MYNYFKNMSQEFRLKDIDETRNHLLEEIKHINKDYKQKKFSLSQLRI